MTTKLPDASPAVTPTKELPPDPMLRQETLIVAGNYLMRVNDAVPTAAGVGASTPLPDVAKLFHAALAFESDIRLITMNQLVESLQGTPYAGGSLVLDAPNLDIQQITNSLVAVANSVIAALGAKNGPTDADDLRAYIVARGSVRYILESVSVFR